MNTRVVSMLMLVSVLAVPNAIADDKVYLFAVGNFNNRVEYLDYESHQIKGYNADVINAVCDIANKTCELVWDVYSNCWVSSMYTVSGKGFAGHGLMSKWYTACTGWPATYERLLTFAFTRPFTQTDKVVFYARKGSSQDYSDLSGLNVGFLVPWAIDEACLSRYTTDPTHPILVADLLSDNNQTINYYYHDDLIAAVQNGTVDVAFSVNLPQLDAALDTISPANFPNKCQQAGPGMMTRKDNKEFIRWWDDAFSSLVGTSRYDAICKNIINEHGHISGGSPSDICIGY